MNNTSNDNIQLAGIPPTNNGPYGTRKEPVIENRADSGVVRAAFTFCEEFRKTQTESGENDE